MCYILSPHFIFMCFWSTCMMLRLFNFFGMNYGLVNYWYPPTPILTSSQPSYVYTNGTSSTAAAPVAITSKPEMQENPTAALLLKLCSFILFGGILCAPLAGFLIDTLRHRFSRATVGESKRAQLLRESLARVKEGDVEFNYNNLYSTVPPLTIATVLCLLVSILVFVPSAATLGIAYVAFTCFRAFLFSTLNSYMYVRVH